MLFSLFMLIGIFCYFFIIGILIMMPFKKRFRTKKTFIKIAIFLVASYVSIAIANIIDEHETSKLEYEWRNKWNSVDKVKQSIENSSWTYHGYIEKGDNYDRWCRLKFKNGKLYFYEVSPSEGEWGSPEICDYVVEERRYSNTGGKYICIIWNGKFIEYMLIPAEKELSYQTNSGYVYAATLSCYDNNNPWENR